MKDGLKSRYSDQERLNAWIEWKTLCNIGICTSQTQDILRYHAESNVSRYFMKFQGLSTLFARDDKWELFEEYAVSRQYKKESKNFGNKLIGKSYKDGIFYKAENSEDPPLKVFSGEFNAMMRNVIKNACPELEHQIKTGTKGIQFLSLDEKVSSDSDTTYMDLLKDEADILDPSYYSNLKQLQEIASELSKIIFDKLTDLQRIALFAEENGIKRTDEYLCQLLQISDSTLNDHFNKYIPRIYNHTFAEKIDGWDGLKNSDDKFSYLLLVRETRTELMKMIFFWSRSEKICKLLLKYKEDKDKEAEESD